VYDQLFELVKDKDYFVLTTNVDHCFQKAGFEKKRMFYTQGDYGLWQCSEPCCQETHDNQHAIFQMVQAQGFVIAPDGTLTIRSGVTPKMTVPTALLPVCPHCGKPMTMNLRSDDKFVEDEGWHVHAEYYSEFLRRHQNGKTLFLELAVGFNTPAIIKYSFWRMVNQWPNATYACLNYGEAYAPDEIKARSICINSDIGDILRKL
jgi:NAD-dependent SIR2 family protein deacetylase